MTSLRRRCLPLVAVALAATGLAAGACSNEADDGAHATPPVGSEGGANAEGSPPRGDSSLPTTTVDPPPAPVNAKQLATGEVFLIGVTSDGYAIYVANTYGDGPLQAVSLAGGAPVTLAPFVHFEHVVIKGRGVAYWTDVIGNPLRGTLNLWTHAAGPKVNIGTSVADEAYFSDDGSRVVVLVNPQDAVPPATVDIVVTSVAAPSLTPTFTSVNMDPDTDVLAICAPQYSFLGNQLFVTNCTAAVPQRAFFRSVSDTGIVTTLVDNTTPAAGIRSTFTLDRSGEKAFLLGTNGDARVFTVSSGATVVLDTAVVNGSISQDGTSAVYVKEIPPATPEDIVSFSLRRSPTAAPDPKVLRAVVGGVLAKTPDLTSILFNEADTLADGRSDLYLVDATQDPPAPATLSDQPTGLAVGFTATGSHAVYTTDVAGGIPIGKLKTRGVGAGGLERLVSNAALFVRPFATGTRVAYCENVKIAKLVGDHTTCDVATFDAASAAASVSAVTKADPYFFTLGSQLVFALSWGPSRGIYVKTVP